MDKYNSGKGAAADRGFWLTAFNGGSYTVDRISRGTTYIPNLSASVLGGIQPDAIRHVRTNAVDDGLIQRLIPVILSPAGVDEDVLAGNAIGDYEALVYRLTKLPEVGLPAPDNPFDLNVTRRHAVFDSGAQEIRRAFERYTNKLTQLEAISPQFAAFCGKLNGIFARIALVFHCVEHINLASQLEAQRIPERINEETAKRTVRLMREFVIPHALHFYLEVGGETPVIADARSIAGYILAHKVKRVTFGDLTSSVRCCRKKPRDDVIRMMEPLDMMNWVQREGPGPIPRAWTVTPAVHDTFAAKAAQERERRDEVRALLQQSQETRK